MSGEVLFGLAGVSFISLDLFREIVPLSPEVGEHVNVVEEERELMLKVEALAGLEVNKS